MFEAFLSMELRSFTRKKVFLEQTLYSFSIWTCEVRAYLCVLSKINLPAVLDILVHNDGHSHGDSGKQHRRHQHNGEAER